MNHSNRDLLILFNQERMSPGAVELEVERLHEMLFTVERMENLAIVHELIDLNRFRVIHKKPVLRKILRYKQLKPFVFLNCRN
ncbi:MAG: hypothetical protein IPI66_10175 [Chitinophagaceae bacterium]|nr:hypothetical protein [Chitinophagaceae bacterium]MBL0055250.1 hypothetical protein [Chitinophagaceae bacterium]